MTGSLTLAKGRRKIGMIIAPPPDWQAAVIADIKELTCQVARNNFKLGFDESDTVDDPPLCSTSNVKALDASNFSASFDLYRYLIEGTGAPGTDDINWATLSTKGTSVWIIERETPLPLASVAWTANDEGWAYPFTVDNPGWPSDLTGYLKRSIRLSVAGDAVKFKLAAGA